MYLYLDIFNQQNAYMYVSLYNICKMSDPHLTTRQEILWKRLECDLRTNMVGHAIIYAYSALLSHIETLYSMILQC